MGMLEGAEHPLAPPLSPSLLMPWIVLYGLTNYSIMMIEALNSYFGKAWSLILFSCGMKLLYQIYIYKQIMNFNIKWKCVQVINSYHLCTLGSQKIIWVSVISCFIWGSNMMRHVFSLALSIQVSKVLVAWGSISYTL